MQALSKSTENLAKMRVIVTIFQSADLTVRNKNGDNAAPHTQQCSPGPTARCRSGSPEIYMQTMHFL